MASVSTRDLVVDLEGVRILHGVDLDVAAGEWLNVIGPNGAGKTSPLRSPLGTVAHEGSIELAGAAIDRPMDRARVLAYVPQSPVIPPGMYVADYVMLGRTPHRGVFGRDSATDLTVAADVLQRLDLGGFADREVRSLSGGEGQVVQGCHHRQAALAA